MKKPGITVSAGNKEQKFQYFSCMYERFKMSLTRLFPKKQAYTLAEVLIAIVVIGIVAIIIAPVLFNFFHQKVWDISAKSFENKMIKASRLMKINRKLAGYSTTKSFMQVFKNYTKILKVCDNITECFPNKVILDADGKELTINNSMKPVDLGLADWNTDLIGVKFANGFTGIIAYNPSCKSSQEPALSCLSVLYDTSGYKNPNTLGKDVRIINLKENIIASNNNSEPEPAPEPLPETPAVPDVPGTPEVTLPEGPVVPSEPEGPVTTQPAEGEDYIEISCKNYESWSLCNGPTVKVAKVDAVSKEYLGTNNGGTDWDFMGSTKDGKKMSYGMADKVCKDMGMRLPSVNELKSMCYAAKEGIIPPFEPGDYLTSSAWGSGSSAYRNGCSMIGCNCGKAGPYVVADYIRCVKD